MTHAHTERAGACAQPPCLNFPAASVAGLFPPHSAQRLTIPPVPAALPRNTVSGAAQRVAIINLGDETARLTLRHSQTLAATLDLSRAE